MIEEVVKFMEMNEPLPTEVANIFKILTHIKSEDSKTQEIDRVFLIWLKSILMNPFSITKLIKDENLSLIKIFLLDCLEKYYDLKKDVKVCMALLINNILLDNIDIILYRRENSYYYIFDKKISIYDFYGVLKQISKLGPVNPEYSEITEKDSMIVKRYKIKILENCRNNFLINFKTLLKFINENDTKLGWTLSKAFYRISKHLDKQDLMSDLKKLISGTIFGDEQLWINIMTFLGFLILEGDISDCPDVHEALLYDNEFVMRSSAVRETALFYVWTILRASNSALSYMKTIIYMALFDSNLSCRRAAVSIVQEYIGRCPEEFKTEFLTQNNTLDDSNNVTMPENMSLVDGLLLIDQINVKRATNCLEIFFKINRKDLFKDFVLRGISHFDRSIRIQSAVIYSRFYPVLEVFRYENPYEKDGLHLLIGQYIRMYSRDINIVCFNNSDNELLMFNQEQLCEKMKRFCLSDGCNIKVDNDIYENTTYTNCSEEFYPASINILKKLYESTLNSFTLTNSNYNIRNMNFVIESYLNLYNIICPSIFASNLIFLIKKGFSPEILIKIVPGFTLVLKQKDSIHPSSNSDLKKFHSEMYRLISTNNSGVLVNTTNETFRNESQIKYLENLNNGIFVDYTIKALRVSNIHFKEADPLIKRYLDDYTVNFQGDAGADNRREAFFYFLDKDFNIAYYFHRFIFDKSKKIREFLIKVFYKYLGRESKRPQFYSNVNNIDVVDLGMIDSNIINKMNLFFADYENYSLDLGPDECYFKALMNHFFDDNKGAYEGIISTLSCCDTYLRDIIHKLITSYYRRLIIVAIQLIKDKQFVLESLKFLISVKSNVTWKDVEEIKADELSSKTLQLYNELIFGILKE